MSYLFNKQINIEIEETKIKNIFETVVEFVKTLKENYELVWFVILIIIILATLIVLFKNKKIVNEKSKLEYKKMRIMVNILVIYM